MKVILKKARIEVEMTFEHPDERITSPKQQIVTLQQLLLDLGIDLQTNVIANFNRGEYKRDNKVVTTYDIIGAINFEGEPINEI